MHKLYLDSPLSLKIKSIILKLDGVGPVDNRPSTNKLPHFFNKKKMLHVTRAM